MRKNKGDLDVEKRILRVIGQEFTEGLQRLSWKVYNTKGGNVSGVYYKRMKAALKKLKQEGKISLVRSQERKGRVIVRRLMPTRANTKFVTTDSSMPASVQSLLSGFESRLQKERKRWERAEDLIAQLKDIFAE